MARADLHYALVVDDEIYRASTVDASLLDPLVRAPSLPGTAMPMALVREYQGPQGGYLEQIQIVDPDGTVVAQTPLRRIELRGEMFEDRFVTTLRGVTLASGDEHTARFVVNGDVVGEIPIFVELGQGGDHRVAAEETFTKAVQKGAVVWLDVPQPPIKRNAEPTTHHQPVWFTVDAKKLYVITGEGEQQVPNLPQADTVRITARSKDMRSRVSEVDADVRVIDTDDELWEKVATAAMGRRLNLPDGEGALERWRTSATMVELAPRFRPAETAATPQGAVAAGAPAPAEAPAEAAEAAPAKQAKKDDDIHVEAQIDQEVFDKLVAEGSSERVARAKAKAAYVRAEKKRLRAEQSGDAA